MNENARTSERSASNYNWLPNAHTTRDQGLSGGANHGPQGGGNGGWSSGSSEGEARSRSSNTSIQNRAIVMGQTFRDLKSFVPNRVTDRDGWSQAPASFRRNGRALDGIMDIRSATTSNEIAARAKAYLSPPHGAANGTVPPTLQDLREGMDLRRRRRLVAVAKLLSEP